MTASTCPSPISGRSVTDAELLATAKTAAAAAWAPYSHFPVGAAIVTDTGDVITGCNVENASYGLTLCAERNAATTMVATTPGGTGDGEPARRKIAAVAIAGLKAAPLFPCGACRQVLHEFSCDRVIVEDGETGDPRSIDFAELLPRAFGPDDL